MDTMPDPREAYGRVFHEQGRLTVNAEREKPFGVQPWKGRTDEEKELDMRGASAVAAEAVSAERERAEYWHKRWTAACDRADQDGTQAISQHLRIQELGATLAEIRQAVATFITIRGEQAQAGDLAEAVRQILDREPLEGCPYPSTAGMEAAARDLEEAPAAELDGQLPLPGVA